MLTRTLKAVRKEIGVTQDKAAKLLGISLRTYRDKEKGKRPFDQIEMIRIIQEAHLTFQQAAEIFFSKDVNEELFKQYDIEGKKVKL